MEISTIASIADHKTPSEYRRTVFIGGYHKGLPG